MHLSPWLMLNYEFTLEALNWHLIRFCIRRNWMWNSKTRAFTTKWRIYFINCRYGCRRVMSGCWFGLNFDFIRRTRDVIIAPFDDHDVLAPIARQVTHVVVIAASVLHKNFLARSFRSIHAHIKNIVTCNYSIDQRFQVII